MDELIVVSSGPFPYGGAATNRHISYLKGCVEMGVSVNVLLLSKSKEQSDQNLYRVGSFAGIRYQHLGWSLSQRSGLARKVFSFIKSLYLSRRIILQGHKKNEKLKLLVLTVDPISTWFFFRFYKRYGISVFHERTEFPFIGNTGFIPSILLKFYCAQLSKIDGLFVITNSLKKFFEKFIDADRIWHLPMTVEPERFDVPKGNSRFGRYIAYCGTMYSDKDGVPILVKAFDAFAATFANINLVLIGDTSDRDKLQDLNVVIAATKHRDRIYLTGRIERDEMPELLVNAEVLALARPDNIQAKGGFPTKLGEYLATGNPVVVTRVGEIPNYLTHLENAYIASPDDIDGFAAALRLVFTDKEQADRIGCEGKKLAYGVFNYKTQAQTMVNVIYG